MARRKSGGKKSKLPKLGSGKRFASLTRALQKRKDVTNPEALAAWIGRKKYGKKRFQKLATAGKRRRTRRAK